MILQEKLSPQRFWQLTSLGAICFVGLWTAAALAGLTSPQFLPTPWAVLDRFVTLWSEPFAGAVLHEHVLASMRRFFLGFGFAVLVGLPLGLLMAWFQPIDRLITPLFETIRFVAPIAWIPFAAIWFGTGIGGPVLIIFMGAFPPVLINTYRGAKFVDKRYLEAASTLGASHWRNISQVLLPAALPSIVSGLRISAGLGWQSLVGAELIVASSGVGYLMVRGQASISTATVMSGMIAIGMIGLILDILIRRLQQVVEARRGL